MDQDGFSFEDFNIELGFNPQTQQFSYSRSVHSFRINPEYLELKERGFNQYTSLSIRQTLQPSVPDAPNWHISAFENRLHETETL